MRKSISTATLQLGKSNSTGYEWLPAGVPATSRAMQCPGAGLASLMLLLQKGFAACDQAIHTACQVGNKMSGRKLQGAIPFVGTKNINKATTRRGYLQHSLSKTPFISQSPHWASQSKGFTLVELIAVIAIIGTAVGLVVPWLSQIQNYIESGGSVECDSSNELCRLLQERTDQSTAAAAVIVETETNAGIEKARNLGKCGSPDRCDELQGALDKFKAAASGQSSSVSVPGPLPIFGVASAFYFSRKLRKRIKASRSEKK